MPDSLVFPVPPVEMYDAGHLAKLSESPCEYHKNVFQLIKNVCEKNCSQAVHFANNIVNQLGLIRPSDSSHDLYLSDESAKIFEDHFKKPVDNKFSVFSCYLISDIIYAKSNYNAFKTPVLLVESLSENSCGDIVWLNAYFSELPSRPGSKPTGFVLPDLLKSDVISWRPEFDFPKSIQKVMTPLASKSNYRVNWFVSCHPRGRLASDLLGLSGRSAECAAAVLIHQIDQAVRNPQFPSGIRNNCAVTGTISVGSPFGSSKLGPIDGLEHKARKAADADIRVLAIPDVNKNFLTSEYGKLNLQPCATLDDVLIWLQESNQIVFTICNKITEDYKAKFIVIDEI